MDAHFANMRSLIQVYYIFYARILCLTFIIIAHIIIQKVRLSLATFADWHHPFSHQYLIFELSAGIFLYIVLMCLHMFSLNKYIIRHVVMGIH